MRPKYQIVVKRHGLGIYYSKGIDQWSRRRTSWHTAMSCGDITTTFKAGELTAHAIRYEPEEE
jgi:hypothetical protein